MARRKKTSIYSKRTLSYTKNRYRKYKDTRKMSSEISKTFSKANRRLRALDDSKINSLAKNRLTQLGIKSFTKRHSEDLKRDYMRALNFLNDPTSLLSGAKEYISFFSGKYGLDFDTVNMMINETGVVTDFVFTLTNAQYYAIAENYTTIEETLKNDIGFEDNTDDYFKEIERGVDNMHTLYLKHKDTLRGSDNIFNGKF